MNIEYGFFCSQLKKSFFCKKKDVKDGLHLDMKRKQNQCRVIQMICKSLMYFLHFIHGLRTPREEITFTARPKIHSHSQIYRYGRSIFCLPQRPEFSDIFDLCLHWVSVVRDFTYTRGTSVPLTYTYIIPVFSIIHFYKERKYIYYT